MPKPIIQNKPSTGSAGNTSAPSSQPVRKSTRSMSEDTFKKYDDEYKNWKKTGKYSDGFSSWMNQEELDLYKNIKSGNGRSARSNGSYYYMDNDTYDKYGKEYANWKSTNKYSDDFASWKNDDDLNAYKAIRGSRSQQDNAFDDFRYSLNNDVLKAVQDKYRSQWGDKYYYDITDADDLARMNAGQMPKYLANKYKENDSYDQWLYENNLPSTSDFNDMYSQAVLDYNEQQQTWSGQLQNIINSLDQFDQQRAAFLQGSAQGKTPEEMLATGNYDAFVKYYGGDKEEDNPYKARQDVVNAEDYTAYDNVYNALYSGDPEQLSAALNEGFWDKYTEKNWQKYLNQKLKWNEDTLEEDIQRATDHALAVQASVNSGKLSEEQLQNIANSIDTESLEKTHSDISTRKADIDSRVAALKTQPRLSQEQYVELSTLQNESQTMQQQLDAVNEQMMMANNSENQLKLIEINRDLKSQWNDLSRRSDFAEKSASIDMGSLDGSRKAKNELKDIVARTSDAANVLEKAKPAIYSISPTLGLIAKEVTSSTNSRNAINKWMSDDERAMFNYIANTQGADAAIEYTERIRPLMNERSYQAELAQRKGMMDTTTGTIGLNIARPFMQFEEAKEGLLTEITAATGLWELEYHDPRLKTTRLRQGILADTGEQILKATADEEGNATGWGQVLNTVYNMAQSTADNAVRQLVFGSIPAGGTMSALSMSGSVMGSTLSEYMDKGASAEQALTLAFVNAVAEGIGEKFTFDKYLHIKDGNAAIKAALDSGQKLTWGKYLWHEMSSTAVAEAGEEIITEIIDKVMDTVVMGDQSELKQIYDSVKAKGGTDGQAWWEVIKSAGIDIGMAGLGGMFSGVILGGGNMALSNFTKGRAAVGSVKGAMKAGREIALRNANTEAKLMPTYDEAYGHVQDGQHIGYAARIMEQMAEEYREALADGGTVDSAVVRGRVIDAITNATTLTDDQKTAIIDAYEEFAASPASLLSGESKQLLDNFKSVLDNLDAVASANGKKARIREIKRQEAREKFVRDVTPIQQQRDAALEAGDRDGYLSLAQQLREANNRFQHQEEEVQLRDEIESDKELQAEKKAAEPVINAATELADAIESEETEITTELYQRISDARGADQLDALGEQLEREEIANADADYIDDISNESIEEAKLAAMEKGDERTYNLLEDMLEVKKSGDKSRMAEYASKNPDIIEMMWNADLSDAVANDGINNIQEEMVNANSNGRNGQSAEGTGRTGDFSIYLNGERGAGGQAQQADQGFGNAVSEVSEPGGVREEVWDASELENKRILKPWTEKTGAAAEFIEKEYAKHGVSLAVNRVESVPGSYGKVMSAALRMLGIKDGITLYIQSKNDSPSLSINGIHHDGEILVRYTGNAVKDVLYLYHEVAHSRPMVRALIKQALGNEFRSIVNNYIRTAPESQKGYSRQEMEQECLCDIFGLFGDHQGFGASANGNEFIDARQLQRVFDYLDNSFSDTAFAEDNESVRQIGTDEKYSLSNRSIEAVENRMMEDKYKDVLAPPEDGQPRFSMRTIMHSAGLNMERKNGAFTVTKNGKNVDSITTKDLNGTQIGAIINQAVDRGFVSARDANKEKTFIKDLVNMMIRNKDADMVWAFAGSQVFSAITNNSDAQYSKTVDFTTICRKTQAIINAMSERMVELQRGLTDEEILNLQNELAQRGEAVPCPVCYVFSRWTGIGGVLERIKNYQQQYADINVARAALANHTDSNAETWLTKVRLAKGYKPVPNDILFDLNRGGDFASKYPLTWKYRTTRGPALGKAMTPYAEMNVGDVVQGMRKSPQKIKKGESSPFQTVDGDTFGPEALKELLRSEAMMRQQNLLGGLRYQSTSDFRTDYALDYLLSFFDVQAIGGKIQTYSKQADGARLLVAVGADVNLSVMPKGKGWKLDADGKEILDTSSVTGMDFKTAVDLKNKYDNAQLIMVGINDDHIRISLANSDIGFVIPYHASGGRVDFITQMARNLGENVRLSEYQNYEDCQTDTIDPNATPEQNAARDLRSRILMGKAKVLSEADQQILDNNPILQNLYNRFYVEGVDPDCYGVKLKKAQANTIMPFEYWDTNSTIDTADENGRTFIKYCESLGLIPRFSGKKVVNGKVYNLDHGNFVDLEGYWKTLIDRPMYNNDGSYHVQQKVNVSGVTSDMLSEDANLQFSSRGTDSELYNLASRDITGSFSRQDEYDNFVDRAAHGERDDTFDFDPVSERLINIIKKYYGVDLTGKLSKITNNDIAHIIKSHGTISDENFQYDRDSNNYTVLLGDIKAIPYILSNFDDAYYIEREGKPPAVVYVVHGVDSTYYLESEDIDGLLFGKQLLKVPLGKVPEITGIENAIKERQEKSINPPLDVMADTPAVPVAPKTYVQDVRDNASIDNIENNSNDVNYNLSSREITSGTKRSQEVAQQATALYDQGVSLTDYYNSGNYDNAVAAQLRGMMLRNGQDVGGKLSEQEVGKIIEDAANWKKGNLYAFKSPVRIFEKLGQWRDTKTKDAAAYSRAVALNMQADEYYSDKYYGYMQNKLAEENVFKAGVLDKINALNPSDQDAILAQLIGEKIITPEIAQNAVMDRKHILIPMGNGAMVLDRKGRVRFMADNESFSVFSDDVLKKAAERARKINEIRNDSNPDKDERIRAIQNERRGPEETLGVYRLKIDGNHYSIVNQNGDAVFEMDGESAYSDKANELAETLSAIYSSMYDSVQSTLVENGYAPIGHIENYFPHFTQAREGVAGMIDYLKSEDLPVGIAGLTPDFSPGKPWARNLLSRMGDNTDYNAVRGFEQYLNGVADVIYMTPVIQRFRQLESALRTGMASKTAEQQDVNAANTNFLRWLHDYTNQLANKKPMIDRGVEETLGRKVYTLPTKLAGWIGTSYIGGNIRTALTNLASFAQGSGQLGPKWIGKGLFNTATTDQEEFGDDFQNVCSFLINRQSQAEEVALNMGDKFRQKGEKILFGLMEAVDNFSTEAIARAKYYQLTQEEGMDPDAALKEVSKWCVKLFAERSKGSRATVFNSKVMSPLTQFQIEPFNQMWHWSDIHNENIRAEYRRILKENGGVLDGVDWGKVENQVNRIGVSVKDLKKILGRLIALSVYGLIMRALTGSDATWNPAGIISDMVNGAKKDGGSGAVKAARENVMDNIPFSSLVEMIGSAVGLGDDEFGSSTSIPIPALSAVNTAVNAIKGGTPESYLEGATYLIPGGGQLRKTAKGIGAYVREGNYNSKGKLRYPIDQNAGNAIRAAVFGPSAVAPRGYEWGNTLNESKTEAYQQAVSRGMDKNEAYDFLLNDYRKDTKTYELASLATSDLDKAEMKLMADILGIEIGSGDIRKQAARTVREQIRSTQKKYDKGQITQKTYEQRMADYDAFMDDLVG